MVQVEVDILTGMYKLVKVYLVHECATPINEEVDRGQIAGAFFQGFGWCTFEEEIYDKKGRYLAVSPSTYKIPGIKDLPEVFEIEMVHLERKQSSVFGSKAIGEPPLIYGEAAFFAIKNAIEAVVGGKREAKLRMPATPEAVLLAVEELLKSTNNEIGIANAKKSEVLAN